MTLNMNARYYEKNFSNSSIPERSVGTHGQRTALLPTDHLQCS